MSRRSLCSSLTLSPATCLFPRFKTGKNAPFVTSLSALRAASLQLHSSNSLTALSSSPLEKGNQSSFNNLSFHEIHGHPKKNLDSSEGIFFWGEGGIMKGNNGWKLKV